ncbi:MAG: GAF domain-containing sensor histidine kinase [Acidobacteriota bacterium]
MIQSAEPDAPAAPFATTMGTPNIGEMTALGRRTPSAQLPRAAVAVRWGIAVAALATLLPLLLLHPPDHPGWLLLFAFLVASADSFFLVRVSPGSYFSISSAFLFVYFLIAGATAAAAMAALAQFTVWVVQRIRRNSVQTFMFAAFNAGQHVLSCLAGGVVTMLIFQSPVLYRPVVHGPIPRVTVFALFYLLSSSALTYMAAYARTGMAEGRPRIWPANTLWVTISFLIGIPFAIAIRLLAPAIGGYAIASTFTFGLLAGAAVILRLNTSLKSGNNELKAINSIGTLINASLNLPEIFGIIARETRKVLLWDGFFIALGGSKTQSIEMIFLSETGTELTRRSIPQGAGLTSKAISSGELIHYEQNEREREIVSDDSFRGRRRPKSLVIAPMKFADEVLGAICVQSYESDVYGRAHFRLLQTIAGQAAIAVRNAQLFESERAAQKERDNFLSLVTHEIKNPLTSIRGYATLAREGLLKDDSQSAAADAIAVIQEESARILRLTEDLLDASKMSAGRFSMFLRQVDLGAIVTQVARRYQATAQRSIDVQVGELLPNLDGDPVRLNQVVENLISNAVKYSPESSPISIGLRQSESRIVLNVTDQGNGIAPDKIPLIFERYYRLEEEGQDVKGTGLGLFITREIVRMHGGEITVNSETGKGTTFVVELPIRSQRAEENVTIK